LPYKPNVPFLISDIRALALRAECQSARISEIKNGALGLYGAEHSKCNRMMTLGFQRLIKALVVIQHEFNFLSLSGIMRWRRAGAFTLVRLSPAMRRRAPPDDVTVPDSDDKRKYIGHVIYRAVSLAFSATRRLSGDVHTPISARNRFGRASLCRLPCTEAIRHLANFTKSSWIFCGRQWATDLTARWAGAVQWLSQGSYQKAGWYNNV